MRRVRLLPIGWTLLIYLVTTIDEVLDVSHAVFRIELSRVVIHAVGYAAMALLLSAVRLGHGGRIGSAAIIALVLIVGVGQEVLQSLLRGRLSLLGSAFDLGVDSMAALLALAALHGAHRLSLRARQGTAGASEP